jgi:hypothetical protein
VVINQSKLIPNFSLAYSVFRYTVKTYTSRDTKVHKAQISNDIQAYKYIPPNSNPRTPNNQHQENVLVHGGEVSAINPKHIAIIPTAGI